MPMRREASRLPECYKKPLQTQARSRPEKSLHPFPHGSLMFHRRIQSWCRPADHPTRRARDNHSVTKTKSDESRQPRSFPVRWAHSLEKPPPNPIQSVARSEEHTSELQSRVDLVCRLLL